MTTLTEALAPCAPIVSEANGFLSRSTATIPGATTIRVGMVLGRLTASGNSVPLAPAAADGSEVAASVALYPVASAASAQKTAVFDKHGELRAADLEWPAGITAPQKATAIGQLLALGIKLR